MPTQTDDLLDPTVPKKTPGPAQPPPSMGGGTPSAIASPSAVDTGVPAPAAPPPPAQPAPPPPAAIETQALTPAPAPAPAAVSTTGVSPQQGVAQLNQTMMTRFNRVLTPQEVQGLAQAIGAPQGPNGTYSGQQMAQAQDFVDRYSGDLQNPFPAAAPAPAPPADPLPPGAITAQQGVATLNDAAERRLGRPLTNQEVQMLAQRAGPPQGPNGTYTQAQLDGALETVGRYSGNLQTPFGTLPESAPGSTTSLAATRLAELLNLDYGEVDPNSQAIQQPLGAFRSAQSRAVDRAKIANALRAQREGTSGGGEEAGLMSLLEEQGQNEAGFEANLYAQELATQRQQLTQAIELATQAGLQNKARELQDRLGTLDIQLRELIGKGQLALGAQQLSQQDQQFLESMGFNYANLIAQQNNRAIEAAL